MNMKRLFVLLAVLALVFMPMASSADVDMVIGLYPASALISPDAEDFAAADWSRYEVVDGDTSWIPSITAGIGFDTPQLFLDLTAGVGYADGGDVYSATFYLADVAARFKVAGADGKSTLVTVGPHASLLYFDAKWKGDVDVEFDPTVGYIIGLGTTIGKKSVSFSASIDYVHMPVDVDQQSNVYTSDDEFDLSGIAFQMGILFRF